MTDGINAKTFQNQRIAKGGRHLKGFLVKHLHYIEKGTGDL